MPILHIKLFVLLYTMVFVLLVSFGPLVLASSVVTSHGVLQNYGIAMDEEALIRFLDQGLPDAWESPDHGNHGPRRHEARWQLYGHMASVLGDMKSKCFCSQLRCSMFNVGCSMFV